MRVFIVMEKAYDYTQIKGVFASLSQAEAFVAFGEGFDHRNYEYPILIETVQGELFHDL